MLKAEVVGLPVEERKVRVGVKVNGVIYRSPEWIKERITHLKTKLEDLKNRERNILSELGERQEELNKFDEVNGGTE